MGSHLKTAFAPSPSRKRLLADLPRSSAPAPPANSPLKKTRDLPNLSECHSCKSRTDAVTGKNPVKFMYSEWRVVILCKRCLSRVESSEICSYCFKVSSGDCISCCQCMRSVHNTCFLEKKSMSPWSYSCSEPENLVCVDCWLPDSIARKRGLLNNSKIENSRVSDSGDCTESFHDSVGNENCVEERNELAEKGAVEASSASDSSESASKVDDVKLALHLHRAINSSPRISRNRDGNYETVSESNCAVRDLDNSKPRLLFYARRRSNSVSEPGFLVRDLDESKSSSIVYARRRKKGEHRSFSCKLYYGLDLEAESWNHQSFARSNVPQANGDMLKYSRRLKGTKPNKKDHLCWLKYSRRDKDKQPDGNSNRCLLKYSRRSSNSLAKPSFFMQRFNLESEASSAEEHNP